MSQVRIPYPSDSGLDASELELTWNPPPWRQAFMVADGIMEASKGESNQQSLSSYDPSEPQQQLAWPNNPKGAIVEYIP